MHCRGAQHETSMIHAPFPLVSCALQGTNLDVVRPKDAQILRVLVRACGEPNGPHHGGTLGVFPMVAEGEAQIAKRSPGNRVPVSSHNEVEAGFPGWALEVNPLVEGGPSLDVFDPRLKGP